MIPFKQSILAAGLLALSGGIAAANPAVTQGDIHLRAGPGPGYGVLGVVPGGAPVEAWNCDGAWCKVNFNGRIGFASEHFLEIGRTAVARRVVVTEPVIAEPVVTEQAVAEPAPGYLVPQYGQQITQSVDVMPIATAPAYVRPAYRTYAYETAPLAPNPLDFPLLPWNW
jgi:uncharacterized protein YraI